MKKTVKYITVSAMVAAVYVAATVVLGAVGFGPVQFRVAEALTLLPFLFPQTIGGIFIGCLVSNLLMSPYVLDVALGSLASLAAAIWTSRIKNKYIAPLPPVLLNAVAVGFVIAFSAAGNSVSGISAGVFLGSAISVGVSEAAVCYGLGVPLVTILSKERFKGL